MICCVLIPMRSSWMCTPCEKETSKQAEGWPEP